MTHRMLVPLAALGLVHAACYIDEDDFTAQDLLVLDADDADFHADGVSECIISATYPMGASPGQPLKITTTLPGGEPRTQMVVTAARGDPTKKLKQDDELLDTSPQELLRLRSSSQPGDALVVVDAGDWSQQVVCEAKRAWPTSVALQSTVNTLRADGATSTDLTVTVRRDQDTGAPSVDTRVNLTACCASDDTATCASWFNLPSVVGTAPATPERIALNLPLTAIGAGILNEETDATHAAHVEARIFAEAVTRKDQPEKTCVDLNATVKDGADPPATIDLVTLRLLRQPM